MTTTDTTIDDPVGEFTELPFEVQQSLLQLYACCELMLPEERRACAATQASFAQTLEVLGTFPLTHRVSISIIQLLTEATLAEARADERGGL